MNESAAWRLEPRTMVAQAKTRLYLVNPASGSNVAGLTECMGLLGYRYLCANLSLPTLAALVDESLYEVTICDENVEAIDFDLPCDVVGLTIYHYQRERTIAIAREFRRRGRLVIVGGPYATQNLEGGHPAFDVVFCGEAEHTWPEFLRDYRRGMHREIYTERTHPDITVLPPPRFDLMRHQHYLLGAMQVSRGCPYQCDFCSCTSLYGHTIRYKTDDQIVAELEQLHRLGYRSIFILDDNLAGDRGRAKRVLQVIRDWNDAKDEPAMFSTSASIDIAHPDLAILFAQARVTNVFVGIETPNTESLASARKYQNLGRDTVSEIRRLHAHGLDIAAGIMVGFDDDDRSIFRRQLEFLQAACTPVCFTGMMVAPDGTPLKERLIREGRYRANEAVGDHTLDTNVVPRLMSVEELRRGYFWLMNQLYDEANFLARVRGALRQFPAKPLQRSRFRPKEMLHPLLFLRIAGRLTRYYLLGGAELRRMFLRSLPLLWRYREHAATTLYWLIAFTHFRETLIRRGVYSRASTPTDQPLPERVTGRPASRGARGTARPRC